MFDADASYMNSCYMNRSQLYIIELLERKLLFIKLHIQDYNSDMQSRGRRTYLPHNRSHNIPSAFLLPTYRNSIRNMQIFQLLMSETIFT